MVKNTDPAKKTHAAIAGSNEVSRLSGTPIANSAEPTMKQMAVHRGRVSDVVAGLAVDDMATFNGIEADPPSS